MIKNNQGINKHDKIKTKMQITQPKEYQMISSHRNKTYKTLILGQGEVVGGAERYFFDFVGHLINIEKKTLQLAWLGGQSKLYLQKIQATKTDYLPMTYPSLRGGWLYRLWAGIKIIASARKLKKISQRHQVVNWLSCTPRTHLVAAMCRSLWRSKSNLICVVHDFTVPKIFWPWISNQSKILVANSLTTRNWLRSRIGKHHWHKIKLVENGIDTATLPKITPVTTIKKHIAHGQHRVSQGTDILC